MVFGSFLGNKECVALMQKHSFVKGSSGFKQKLMAVFGSRFIRLFGYPHFGLRCRVSSILRYLTPQKGDVILDAGCGVGVFSLELAKNYKVYGVDIDKEDLELAKKFNRVLGLNVDFSLSDVSKLKFKDNFFDRILCSEVIEHVKDDKKFMWEFKRVLKPNGIIVLTTPFLKAGEEKHDYGCKKGHEREGYSYKDMRELVKKSGLILIEQKTVYKFFSVLGEKIEDKTSKFLMFPFVFLLSKLDFLCKEGNCLITKIGK